jgi:peptidoglycan/xylan/chitin deacetylase (PgdA/CDA1 family)
MNTDRPTPAPESGTPAEAAEIDESAEPTVALNEPDAGEPTTILHPAEASEPTVVLSAADVADETATRATEEETATPTADEEPDDTTDPPASSAETAAVSAGDEETVALPVEEEPTVALPVGDEPTVALPVGDEPTVALSAGEQETVGLSAGEETAAVSAGDEETVALSAREMAVAVAAASAADDSEPTTALITAESEPTIALPKPRVSPESTAALPVDRESSPDAEPTIALAIPARPAPPPDSDPTVALPSIPAPRTAPTVAPPPSEPTVALLTAPGAPAIAPAPAKPITRRRLLWAVPAVAGTALVGGTIAALAGRDEPQATRTRTPNLVVTEPPPPSPSQAPSPSPTPIKPAAPLMKVPVHTLKDFRKVVPGDAFPSDAIALTIDDGPHPVWTPKILRLLEKHDVPALFFMIGNQVLGHEATARDVVADGHIVANHTWSHPIKIAELPPHVMLKEIDRAQDKIYSTTGYAPSMFRAPGGAWSDPLSQAVSKSSVIPMDWTNDPRDWARPGVAHITNRLMSAKPGQILLCHDGGGDRSQTLAALKTVIPALKAKGLKFVALT